MADRRFEVQATPLEGLALVTRLARGDERGFLSRLYCREELAAIGFTRPIVQINHTLTRAVGTVRGMHFQMPPAAEDKFVSVLAGAVLDVVVDLRVGSPTFLSWHAEELSAVNRRSLFIPRGFAHGFQTLLPDSELIYLHTHEYTPEAEGGLNPLDPRLAIDWPRPIVELSARDRGHAMLSPTFPGIIV